MTDVTFLPKGACYSGAAAAQKPPHEQRSDGPGSIPVTQTKSRCDKTLKYIIAGTPKWNLYKIYSDRDSGGNLFRPGFQELIFDCYKNKVDVVLVKTISRFARNTVDLLDTVRRLKSLGIEVIFHEKNIRTSASADDMLLSALSAIAQAQSESTSESVKWGLKRGFISGNSKLYMVQRPTQ